MLANQPSGDALTLPCFVQSLDRPLATLASSGVFSAQPAVGERSPRMFLFSGNLVMSVVPAGVGADLLELAEYAGPTRSVKAEIAFPVAEPLAAGGPFDRIMYQQQGTACGFCHYPEREVTPEGSLIRRFESEVLRPSVREEVPLSFVDAQRQACDPVAEPARCRLLTAIFGHGAVVEGRFSPTARTIWGTGP
jgi:hypothetical protein